MDFELKNQRAEEFRSHIRDGSFLLCVDPVDVSWSVFVAREPVQQHAYYVFVHSAYTDNDSGDRVYPEFKSPRENPVSYNGNQWDDTTTKIDWIVDLSDITSVFNSREDLMLVIQSLREETEHYMRSIKPFQERFAMRAALLPVC